MSNLSTPPFRIFQGDLKAAKARRDNPLAGLPDPPPWRRFGQEPEDFKPDPRLASDPPRNPRERDLAEAYRFGGETEDSSAAEKTRRAEILDAVNAALFLRRPLLVTGPAGAGKSSLIYAVAAELRLGPVLTWNITSRSTLREGLYDYDALGRLQAIQMNDKLPADKKRDIGVAKFLRLGPLGTALLPAQWPKALLIDEIDKADLDLPNDLLNVFEEAKFAVEELRREAEGEEGKTKVRVRTWRGVYTGPDCAKGEVEVPADGDMGCHVFPFIVLTSNNEREFSAPFLRRCVRLDLKLTREPKALARIARAHLSDSELSDARMEQEADWFLTKMGDGKLSTDQLMNAIFLLDGERFPTEEARENLLKILYKELK